MPVIRINHQAGSFTDEQKASLARKVGTSILGLEMGDENVTPEGLDIVFVQFSETPHENWLVGGVSRKDAGGAIKDIYIIEILLAPGFFDVERRIEAHRRVGRDFAEVLPQGHPALAGRIVTILSEAQPNGWGSSGKVLTATDIATIAGVGSDTARYKELAENVQRQKLQTA
jgi:phenylpyruvate tautomerase PptA (4-oxalocrotonate tautomerase family)